MGIAKVPPPYTAEPVFTTIGERRIYICQCIGGDRIVAVA